MKHPVKRMLSFMLVLVMCLSLLSGLTFAASVDYKTGDPGDGFTDVILNWGTRGTTATFLSPNALTFYEDNDVTYSALSALDGAASVGSVPGSELYQTLQSLMAENHQVITSYADTRPLYSFTDCQESTRSKLTCFYSGISIGPDWDSGATWNREHTWPNSKGMEGDDENDIMMLRPASTSVNSSRGNKAYGLSATSYDPNSTTGGKLNLHGDVARIALYVYVRWGNTEKFLGDEGTIESLDLLLDWMKEDPVDTWEMGRNDSVESITGTRNVFIDYPELAFALFDREIPKDMVTPSGEAINSGISHTITALSNNNEWGKVSLSGKTINASPATGYEVAGYTVVSGQATVIRKGNAFTVDADSDCTVQIDFCPRVAKDIRFFENGTETLAWEIFQGDTITFPESTVFAGNDYTFIGWINNTLEETSEKPAQVYLPGTTYSVTEQVSYYALYSRLDAQGSGSSTAYELFNGDLVEGNYLITYDNGALKASVGTNTRMDFSTITPVGNTVDNPAASIVWELSFTGDGYVTLYNASVGSYVAGTGAKNKATLITSLTDYGKWTASALEGGLYEFVNLGNANKGVNKTLRRNADFGFACYAESTGGSLTLYKQASGTVYYSTQASACPHYSTSVIVGVEATCTESGYTQGIFCNSCKSYISGHEKLPAKGHSYDAVVTPPTATAPGFTTYTCTACGDNYSGDFVDALGEQFEVTFVVPQGVAKIDSMMCGEKGISLPTAGTPSQDYTFAGWVAEQVKDTTDAPTVYTDVFTTKEDVTLYALYTYITGASQEVAWKLVTNTEQLSAGDQVILGANTQGKVAGDIYSQYLLSVDAQFSADGTTVYQLPENALVLTLGESEEGWTLANGIGQLLGVTGAKKVAWDRGTFGWSISIDEANGATVASSNEGYGRFLYNVKSPRFTVYTSDATVIMLLPQLYKLEGSLGTVHYTTLDGETEPQGVTVSGTVTVGKSNAGSITVELWTEGAEAASYTVTAENGTYAIENVLPGSYTLKISKENHVTRAYAITVDAEAVTQDGKICPIGDVTGDGRVNAGDVAKLFAYIKGGAELADDYAMECANANGGKLNIGDVSRIYAHVTGKTPLF